MSSRSEQKEVEVINVDKLNSGNVSESLDHGSLLREDDERSSSLNVSSVSQLSLSSSKSS